GRTVGREISPEIREVIVYNEDNYYAVVYSAKHDNTANYRLDRMDNVEVIDEGISERALALRDSVSEYTEQGIKMYGGELQTVILEFDIKLIGAGKGRNYTK
ncbi:MAG: WYL domain-containing protein, partial [Lachnospiraceae bacterium]|nr:WYL domain-containing protein [Lachnospiraceae bacterium]